MSGGRVVRKRAALSRASPPEYHPQPFEQDILTEVQALFSKVKDYQRPGGGEWQLPDAGVVLSEPPHAYPRLQSLKRSLNTIKNQLSDKDLETWHQHTCFTNRAGTVTTHLRSTANAELCTQAWAKFYEVLGTFELFPAKALQQGELLSVHLCEAPGAFISALNHFLRTRGAGAGGVPCDWSWLASTLNPYHEGNPRTHAIADDRLLAATLPWWFFGSDDTGDIMRREHLLELQALVRRWAVSSDPDATVEGGAFSDTAGGGGSSGVGGAHLVTADGSFDCQGDPGEQESAVAPLQLCEAVCALMVLEPGGSLVLKMFTLLEHSSVCLTYLLACCFSSLQIFKPATSKAGNSEVYLVALDYQPPARLRPVLAKLLRQYGPDMTRGGTVALFPASWVPDSFLRQHEEVCEFFHDLQVATIQENLLLFEHMGPQERDRLERLRECTSLYYTQRFQVQSLSRKSWLARGGCVSGVWALGGVWSRLWGATGGPQRQQQRGSFNERQLQRTHTWRQRLAHAPFCHWVEDHHTHTLDYGLDFTLQGPGQGYDLSTWYLLVGGALDQVRSSAFCEPGLLGLLNQALDEAGGEGAEDAGNSEVPVCFSCATLSPSAILLEVSSRADVTSCLVLGEPSWWGVSPLVSVERPIDFSPDPCPAPWPQRLPLLHDGEWSYQRQLLRAIVAALPRLCDGAALVLPFRSAFSRVTAAVLLALHLCFRSLEFRCPTSPGPPVVLLCLGYVPPASPRLLTALEEALARMEQLQEGEETRGERGCTGGERQQLQVLQIAPMEELLRGRLPHFLCCLNSAVARQRLHLLLQEGASDN